MLNHKTPAGGFVRMTTTISVIRLDSESVRSVARFLAIYRTAKNAKTIVVLLFAILFTSCFGQTSEIEELAQIARA